MKKLLLILSLALFLLPTTARAVSNLPYGSSCTSDSECGSGSCNKANSGTVAGKSFCSCSDNTFSSSDDEYCRTEFQSKYPDAKEENWECVEATKESGGLDYCQNGPIAEYPAGIQTDGDTGIVDTVSKALEGASLTENEIEAMLKEPEPRIKIPGLEFSDTSIENNKVTDSNGVTYLVFPFLGEYLAAVYKYILVVISIVSVVMLIVAGFQWAVPDASGENISSAKNRIAGALSGLVIAVGSYVILYTVNPELVQFRSLRVQYVAGIDLADYQNNPSSLDVDDGGGTPYSQANLDGNSLNAAKGQGCGKNLVAIAEAFSGQTICQGPCHCANFVSRVLAQSGCDKSFMSDSAPRLKNKLIGLGWQLHDGLEGVEPGDIVFWGKSNESPGHVEIAYNTAGYSIGSSVNMTACWQGKAKEIQAACGEFWQLGYYGGEKKPSLLSKYNYNGDKDTVKQQYSACVAKYNVCPPYGSDRPELCGYCAKIGPANEFYKAPSCTSRQCVQVTKGQRWGYYVKNPNNN